MNQGDVSEQPPQQPLFKLCKYTLEGCCKELSELLSVETGSNIKQLKKNM